MFSKFRKSGAIAMTAVVAVSTILSASAASTTKNLSSNFTLVNLATGDNNGTIQYVKEDGTPWRTTTDPNDTFTLSGLGAQLERRQYFDDNLPAGSGSVVVSTDGPVGAVVQIQARGQSASNGAYVGVSEGSAEASLPIVMRRKNTASGTGNSQIIVQNASSSAIDIVIKFYDGITGLEIAAAQKTFSGVQSNASREYDLQNDEASALGENWIGSAVVSSPTAGGEVAVVSNLFSGDHAMQTFNAFTTFKKKWGVPLIASRLPNGLSTPLVIQNKSGGAIPIDAITLTCQKSATSIATEPQTLTLRNKTSIPNNVAFFDFNPVVATDVNNNGFPASWQGSCTVDAGTFDVAVVIQMRVVGQEGNGNSRAGAYTGIPLDGTNKTVVIPLWARRLTNGFSSNVTILNLSATQPANVTLEYKGTPGLGAECSATFTRVIPANGALFQNHRVEDAVAESVPQVATNCQGTLTVTSSDQPIDGFVQLDQLDTLSPPVAPLVSGDRFMAHNVFLLP